MHPDDLASILEADPYPGCVVTRPGGAVRLDFDGLTLLYKADGWHFGDARLEGTLSDYSAPEQVHPEIRRILKVVMSLKVGRALGEAETLRSEDPVEYLTDLCADKMLSTLDVAALANVRQAKIASNVAQAAARDMRIAELERDLAAKDASLKTAHAALKRICEVIGADVPCVAEDAVEAVKRQLGADNDAENRAKRAEATIAEIGLALDDYDTPTHYSPNGRPHDKGAALPAAERVRVGLMVLWSKWSEAFCEARESSAKADRLSDEHYHADKTLDALGAPRQAGGADLDLSARIRSLPR